MARATAPTSVYATPSVLHELYCYRALLITNDPIDHLTFGAGKGPSKRASPLLTHFQPFAGLNLQDSEMLLDWATLTPPAGFQYMGRLQAPRAITQPRHPFLMGVSCTALEDGMMKGCHGSALCWSGMVDPNDNVITIKGGPLDWYPMLPHIESFDLQLHPISANEEVSVCSGTIMAAVLRIRQKLEPGGSCQLMRYMEEHVRLRKALPPSTQPSIVCQLDPNRAGGSSQEGGRSLENSPVFGPDASPPPQRNRAKRSTVNNNNNNAEVRAIDQTDDGTSSNKDSHPEIVKLLESVPVPDAGMAPNARTVRPQAVGSSFFATPPGADKPSETTSTKPKPKPKPTPQPPPSAHHHQAVAKPPSASQQKPKEAPLAPPPPSILAATTQPQPAPESEKPTARTTQFINGHPPKALGRGATKRTQQWASEVATTDQPLRPEPRAKTPPPQPSTSKQQTTEESSAAAAETTTQSMLQQIMTELATQNKRLVQMEDSKKKKKKNSSKRAPKRPAKPVSSSDSDSSESDTEPEEDGNELAAEMRHGHHLQQQPQRPPSSSSTSSGPDDRLPITGPTIRRKTFRRPPVNGNTSKHAKLGHLSAEVKRDANKKHKRARDGAELLHRQQQEQERAREANAAANQLQLQQDLFLSDESEANQRHARDIATRGQPSFGF